MDVSQTSHRLAFIGWVVVTFQDSLHHPAVTSLLRYLTDLPLSSVIVTLHSLYLFSFIHDEICNSVQLLDRWGELFPDNEELYACPAERGSFPLIPRTKQWKFAAAMYRFSDLLRYSGYAKDGKCFSPEQGVYGYYRSSYPSDTP